MLTGSFLFHADYSLRADTFLFGIKAGKLGEKP